MNHPNEDYETCSWCTAEVLEESLLEIQGGDGARICPLCRIKATEAAPNQTLTFVR